MRFGANKAWGHGASLLALAATAGLAGCGPAEPAPDCGKLVADKVWVTPAHAGSREMLGYMVLHNPGARDVVITGVTSSQFDRAIFQDKEAAAHAADDESGGAQPLAPFTVAAGQDFKLAPNKREIALYSPTQAYKTGDQVELTLACGKQNARLSLAGVVRSGDSDDTPLPPADDDTERTEKALQNGHADSDVSATDDSKTAH